MRVTTSLASPQSWATIPADASCRHCKHFADADFDAPDFGLCNRSNTPRIVDFGLGYNEPKCLHFTSNKEVTL